MSLPAPEVLEREQHKLYVTDAELIRRLGVPEKIARPVIQELDKKATATGFPQKQKLWGYRRYWPAIEVWLDRHNGLNMPSPQPREKHRG